MLVDPSFAVATDGYESILDRRRAHLHYMGGAVTLWFTWLLAIAVGATIGARVPDGLQLEMIIPLFLVGEVVHRVRDRATTCAAVVATLAAIAAAPMPMHLGPIIAIAVGVAAGLHAERLAS